MNFKDVDVTPVQALYEPENNKAVQLQASASASLFFEWESAKSEDGGAPLYEVVFDLPGGNFSNPIYKVLADNNGARNYATISHKDLNKIGQKAGLAGGETGDVIWSVVASRGINTTSVATSRKLTITRLLGFAEVPSQVFLTGEATEGGANLANATECISPEADVFQVVTYLKGGKGFKLVSSRDGNGMTFHVNGSSILEGDGEYIVEEEGIYRLTFDFSIASVKMNKIDKVEFFFSPTNEIKFELPYVGNGVFSGVGSLEFKQEGWGRDERYKFVMTYGDGSQKMWGADPSIDSRPNGAPVEDSYWYAYEWDWSQWDQKWKLDGKYDYNVPFRATLYFNEAQPRHFIEDAGDAPTPPDQPAELTAPESLSISGEATEGGEIATKKLDDNTFELYTSLKGGKTFKAGEYHAENGEIKPGAGDFSVADDGVYRLTFDFAAATFKAEKITRMSVMDCWHDHGSAVLDLTYIGNGEWEATGKPHDSSRNTDNRYKFVMEIEGNLQQWGCANDYDKTPKELIERDGAIPADYYDMKTVGSSQWDDKWKYDDNMLDADCHVMVKLHDTYTHVMELAR